MAGFGSRAREHARTPRPLRQVAIAMHDAEKILAILARCSAEHTFPMLDNGYFYLAASRLSLFRSPEDWALVIETFGFSPRAGDPNVTVETFASRLHQRKSVDQYVSVEAYQRYLANNPHNESRFFYPCDASWKGEESDECVGAEATELRLRGLRIPLPDITTYAAHGIELAEPPRVLTFEMCRYLAGAFRNDVLANGDERRVSVMPDMELLLELDEWRHPDLAN